MEIKVYATLRDAVGGKSVFIEDSPQMTVDKMLHSLYHKYPALRSKLFVDDQPELNPSIQVLVNGRDMRYLDGLETVLSERDEIRLFPPVGGGQ